MADLDRDTLRTLLLRWRAGELTTENVHREAELIWESREWPHYDENDDRSIPLEVVSQLDIMNHQAITVDDIPAMLEFLSTSPGQARHGWRRWRAYWQKIDMEQRLRDLAHDPF